MPKIRKQLYLVAAVTDNPDAWEMVAKKKSKAIVFFINVGDTRLAKADVKYINEHLKRFEATVADVAGGTSVQAGN